MHVNINTLKERILRISINYFFSLKMRFFYYPSQVSIMDGKKKVDSDNTQTPL